MKTKKKIKFVAVGGFLLALSAGFLINFNLEKHRSYKPGQYLPEKDAYFAGEIDDKGGHIKAHKFVVPNDNKYSSQLTRSMSSEFIGNIESVWDTYTGKGTKIAIIDDGFDVDHPEYRRSNNTSAILPESRYYFIDDNGTEDEDDDFVNYQQYSNNSSCIKEEWESKEWASHGTATSTTAAAPMNNNGGVGIAPDANILALKIDFSFASIYYAIQYAVAQGVDVINMSLGAYSETFIDGWGEQQTGSSAVATYLNGVCQQAYNAGIIVVAAAGNESTWHKSYPACNSHVIGVGAIGDWDNKGNATELAEFTNYVKSTQSGEINVDILAPGYVYTAHQQGTESSPTHTYDDTQGTSFSSPIVAGAACLWKEKYPNGTPDQFLSQLQSTADDIGSYKNKMIPVSGWYSELTDVGPSNIENGRLNVAKLLGIDDPYVKTTQSSFSISVGEKRQIGIETSNGTLSYLTSNANVATVSSTGLIEGKSEGSATITVRATKNNKTYDATISVSVSPQIACESISFNPKSISLNVGNTYDASNIIVTTPSNATRSFMFGSGDEDVATVDLETGLITAISAGTTTIEAYPVYGTGEDTLTVTVNQAEQPTSWDKIASTSELEDGDYLIVYETDNKAFNGGLSTLDAANNNIGVTIANSSITYSQSTEAAKFAISSVSGGYSIKSASGYYIGRGTNSNGMDTSTSEAYVNTISFTNGNAIINGSGGKQLLFNTVNDQKRFRYMGSGGNIQLYKGATGSTPTPKTLSSITLDTTNVQKSFEVGDTFNYSGLVVTAHYSDASTAPVTPSSVTAPDMSTAGNKTVTVSYTESTVTKAASYEITVTQSGGSGGSSGTYTIGWGTATGSDGTYTNFAATSGSVTDLLSFTTAKNSSTSDPAYNSNSKELRLYFSSNGNGGSITITPAEDVTFTGFVLTSSTGPTVQYLVDDGSYTTASKDGNTYSVTGISATSSLKIRNSNTTNTQLRILTIALTYEITDTPEKVVNQLVANYSGGNVFVGNNFDTSKVSVTAKYTDSATYPDEILPSSDYQISGFDSSSAGNKTVTVTYTGALETSTSPLTTTFNVTVLADTITSVTASVSKSYHPGETIAKGDITLTVTYQSSRVEHPTDFTFANDGYQFTYADAASGGTATSKTFTNAISYSTANCSLTVSVSRIAYESPIGDSDTITRETTGIADGETNYASWSGKQASSSAIYAGNSAGDNNSIQLRSNKSNSGIVMTASGGNVKVVKVTWNDNTASGRTINIYGKNTAYSAATDLYSSNTQGTLLGTIVYGSSTTLQISGDYAFIGVRSNSGALYLDDISFTFGSDENATNVANYIMFEDTENQCVSKLDTAITYFESMSKEERTLFMTSEDYVIATARERLEAWLANQEKQINIVDGDYVISNNYSTLSSLSESDNEVMVIVVTISFLTISLLTLVYLLRKKRKLI